MIRDPATGHRYATIAEPHVGTSFVLGVDTAYVDRSEVLSSVRGFRLTDARKRVRAGVNWQGAKGGSLFYGLTWLDKEFKAQRESQIVGSVRLKLKF